MAGLSGLTEGIRLWVREIVIILFLAGALEMLLPEAETKRFARVAVGFFVVLAVAKPVLGFFGGGVFDRGLAGLGSWELGLRSSGSGQSGSAADPLSQGAALREASRDRVLAATQAALESQVTALAQRESGVARAEAAVDLSSDLSSTGYGSLDAVRLRVWLAAPPGSDNSGGAPGGIGLPATGPPVTPVSPVTVSVYPIIVTDHQTAPGSGATGTGAAGSGATGSGPSAIDSGNGSGPGAGTAAGELAKRLRSQLVLLFGVPPGGITVEVWP